MTSLVPKVRNLPVSHKNGEFFVKSQAIMVVNRKNAVFLDVTPCILINRHWHFEGTNGRGVQGRIKLKSYKSARFYGTKISNAMVQQTLPVDPNPHQFNLAHTLISTNNLITSSHLHQCPRSCLLSWLSKHFLTLATLSLFWSSLSEYNTTHSTLICPVSLLLGYEITNTPASI
jgi:hypothetical protein